MNTQEHRQLLSEFKAYSKEIIASREGAQQFFIRSGIHTKAGKLAKAYSVEAPTSTEKNK